MPTLPPERVRWIASAAVVVLVVLILLTSFFKTNTDADPALLVKEDDQAAPSVSPAMIPSATPTPGLRIGVDVIGAVQQPGVYYLESPARIVDAIEASGGFAPDADREKINLASHLTDGQQIRVPRVGESAQPELAEASAADSVDGTVDINQADAATLDSLDGIGPATAEAIVEYRTTSGPFKRIEDIQDVKGIGPALFNNIKDHITVGP
ncbi:MAG TPA: ComEA family DNA-binding protein [Herpetosiphonaceae bacterium]